MSSSSSDSHPSSPLTSPKSSDETPSSATREPPPTTSTSPTKAQIAIKSLSAILPSPLTTSSPSPSAAFLLNSSDVSAQISTLLRQPSSGSGDNQLCRWLYDTFQSSDPSLQLVVLRFIPLISGLYLARVTQRHPLAGFEAVLLALYAHETTSRNGQAISVTIPELSNPSIYHETITSPPQRNNSTNLNIAVISPSLEPHGTVRSTRRARIIGVAMELFFSKIWVMPLESKLDFCEFVSLWAGVDGEMHGRGVVEQDKVDNNNNDKKKHGDEWRIPLPWELLQPCLRILGHCLLGENGKGKEELYEKACMACRSLYARALHDVNPKALLAFGSLLKVVKMEKESDDFQHTEVRCTRVISI